MDKKQKELIKTYYRKRNIVADEGYESMELKNYEVNEFAIKNKLIDVNEVYSNSRDLLGLLARNPELIKYFKDRINDEMDGFFIAKLILAQPHLIEMFKDRLNELNKYNIYDLLLYRPQLINYFKDRLNDLDKNDVRILLDKHPQLKKYFK